MCNCTLGEYKLIIVSVDLKDAGFGLSVQKPVGIIDLFIFLQALNHLWLNTFNQLTGELAQEARRRRIVPC